MNAALDTLTAAAAEKHTETLMLSMGLLDSKPSKTPEERTVLAAIFTAIEQRHPEVEPHMEAWAELAWGEDLSYAQALFVSLHRAGCITDGEK